MCNLASVFCDLGRWKEAEALEVQVLETRKRVLGQKHPDTLLSMANLVSTYHQQGRLTEAKKIEVEVLAIRKRCWERGTPTRLAAWRASRRQG